MIENYVNEASAEVKAALLKSIEMLKANGHEIVYKNMLDSNLILQLIISSQQLKRVQI